MKSKLLFLLLIASIVLVLGNMFGMLKTQQARTLSEEYVEETCKRDMRTSIYGKNNRYYAIKNLSNGEMSLISIYLQIKLSIWWVVENVLNAFEYNSLSSCEMG